MAQTSIADNFLKRTCSSRICLLSHPGVMPNFHSAHQLALASGHDSKRNWKFGDLVFYDMVTQRTIQVVQKSTLFNTMLSSALRILTVLF